MVRHVWLLSFLVGFLSLSQEILWVRLVGFAQNGRPQAFSIVLGAFLAGIAVGALVGRGFCARSRRLLRSAGWVLVVAGLLDLLTLQSLAMVLLDTPRRLAVTGALIATTAGVKGILFPIVHHLGTDAASGRVGTSVSRVYLANVLGSTLGPIVTGFFGLDLFRVETVFAGVGVSTLLLGVVTVVAAGAQTWLSWTFLLGSAGGGVVLASASHAVVGEIADAPRDHPREIRHVIQNRQGIIHIAAAEGGDLTFGGNAYDGRLNVDLTINSNGLERAYFATLLHAHPRRVLVIGMSTGAWVTAIRGIPGIERIDVVEINPGYLEIARLYPEVAPLLDDPRVHIHVADGRRWLRARPEARYDVIFQNTTWHWRAYSSMLLSAEYFAQARSHLRPGGVFAVNTTGSLDVYRTALTVFPHVLRYQNFAYMSDGAMTLREDAEAVLRASTINGAPAFPDELFAAGGVGATLLSPPMESAENVLLESRRGATARVVTDVNLLTEFRHGRRPLYGWLDPVLPPSGRP